MFYFSLIFFTMVYSVEQNTFIVVSYFRNGRFVNGEWTYSLSDCKNEFRAKYPDNIQDDSLLTHIGRIVNRFLTTGTVSKGKSSGRPPVSDEIVEDLRERVEETPQISVARLSQQSGVPRSTCHKIIKNRLQLHPYKISVIQELQPADYQSRVEYCNWFQNHLNNDHLLDVSFFSDEAWFHLSGYVNSQNFRIWSAQNPHQFVETPLHVSKIGVWIAVSRRRLIGPIFFNGTINGQRYREQILEPFINELDDEEVQTGYFQHDGATAHTARETLNYLQEFYDDGIISRNLHPAWPPRSPDLTPLDFSIFGYLKNSVFRRPLHNLNELREEIIQCCRTINQEMLQNIFENKRRRIVKCLEVNGGHFQTNL
jgi:hypothetical protein